MSVIFTVVAFVVGVFVGREKFGFVEATITKVSDKAKEIFDKASK